MDGETAAIRVDNIAPHSLEFTPVAAIDENEVATLSLSFLDPGAGYHTIEVDWGDGNTEEFDVGPGATFFETTHQYRDDPAGVSPPGDVAFPIKVRVIDDDGGEISGQTSVVVNNVAPVITSADLKASSMKTASPT